MNIMPFLCSNSSSIDCKSVSLCEWKWFFSLFRLSVDFFYMGRWPPKRINLEILNYESRQSATIPQFGKFEWNLNLFVSWLLCMTLSMSNPSASCAKFQIFGRTSKTKWQETIWINMHAARALCDCRYCCENFNWIPCRANHFIMPTTTSTTSTTSKYRNVVHIVNRVRRAR